MCGAMWSLGITFDTRFFALAACMLGYMRLSIVDFFTYAVRSLVYYMAARKRIQVSDGDVSSLKNNTCITRTFFFWMSLNEIIA